MSCKTAVALLLVLTVPSYAAAATLPATTHSFSAGNGAQVRVTTTHRHDGGLKKVRVDIEDETSAEVISIDTEHDEIAALGLAFRPARDAAGNVTGLTVGDDADAATLLPSPDGRLHAATPDDGDRLQKISKRFASAHGDERLLRTRDVLRSVQPTTALKTGPGGTDAFFNCSMDILALVIDWVGVVAACGAPVVNVFACGWAIAWATADTIHEVESMIADC